MILTLQPIGIGTVFAWLQAHEPCVKAARELLDQLAERPPEQRVVYVNELGDGYAPDELQLWGLSKADGLNRKLGQGNVFNIMTRGCLPGSAERLAGHMWSVWSEYKRLGGQPVRLIASNVERSGNIWNHNFGTGQPFSAGVSDNDMLEWSGFGVPIDATPEEKRAKIIDHLQWAARVKARIMAQILVEPYLRVFGYDNQPKFVNMQDIYTNGAKLLDHNGWPCVDRPFHESAISCPQIGYEVGSYKRYEEATRKLETCAIPTIPCLAFADYKGGDRDAWRGIVRVWNRQRFIPYDENDLFIWSHIGDDAPSIECIKFMRRVLAEEVQP